MEKDSYTIEIRPENPDNGLIYLSIDVSSPNVAMSSGNVTISGSDVTLPYGQAWYYPIAGYYPDYYSYYYSQNGSTVSSQAIDASSLSPPAAIPCAGISSSPALTQGISGNEASPSPAVDASAARFEPQKPSPLGKISVTRSDSTTKTVPQNGGINAKTTLRRLPTPHSSKDKVATSGQTPRKAWSPATTASTRPTSADKQQISYNSGASPRSMSAVHQLPLKERLAHLCRPTRSSSTRKIVAESSKERPLWSGHFSGANSPMKAPPPCRTKHSSSSSANIVSKNAQESISAAQIDGKNNVAATMNPAAVSSSKEPAAATLPGPAITSPVVQYVSYNYKPVVLQSPQAGCSSLPLQVAAAAILSQRQRTTSTLEIAASTPLKE